MILESLENTSSENLLEEIKEMKRQNIRLSMLGVAGGGSRSHKDLTKLIQEYMDVDSLIFSENKDLTNYGDSVELLESAPVSSKIRVAPRALDNHLGGGVWPQTHILVFAPTEMGKTLFVMNMALGFVKQDLRVLYCSNEDPQRALALRWLMCATNQTEQQVYANLDHTRQKAEAAGGHNMIMYELSPGTPHELEDKVEEVRPHILIVDQIRNLDFKEHNPVIQREKAASCLRRLAKAHDLVSVSVTQAADSASGKQILHRGDVEFSNVGIPGQVDLMIGIGASPSTEFSGHRTLSFPKNKINGNHSPVRCFFDTSTMRVKS